jgi:hypothetical protein
VKVRSDTLPFGAGTSLFIGSLSELPNSFKGSAMMMASQRIVGTIVHIPQYSAVRNRPLSNMAGAGTGIMRLPTVLKSTFNTTSVFAIQNTAAFAIDLHIKIYNIANPSTPISSFNRCNSLAGTSAYFDMGSTSSVPGLPTTLNGSAIIEATKNGAASCPIQTGDPKVYAPIVAEVLELSTTGTSAKSYEGVGQGATKLYMPSAMCNAFSGQNTAYAVQNIDIAGLATVVTVTYSSGAVATATIQPGAKHSFLGCDVDHYPSNPAPLAPWSGAATIESTRDIAAIGKAYKPTDANFQTAFLGERQGSHKLALPYVRYASDGQYTYPNNRQRTFIAIQNVGASTATDVVVKYLNKNGVVVGAHMIGSIAPNQKANSKLEWRSRVGWSSHCRRGRDVGGGGACDYVGNHHQRSGRRLQ